MKRLTGDDQERIMRSRALPTGFDLSRAFQPTGGEQSQPPSALAHFTGPSTSFAGGNQIGRAISRSDRRDVPPINMAVVYRNSPYSLSSAGGSSNASETTSISGDLTYSANQSPMFPGSQTSSPFPRGETFQRNFVPPNLNLSSPGTFRARSGSLMSLPSISPLSGGSPLAFPRERVSMDNMQVLYQSQYQGSNRQSPSFDPQFGSMANFPLPSPSLHPAQDYANTGTLMRRNSSSAMPASGAEESFDSAEWFNLSSNEQLPNTAFHVQTHQIRRRQTQPSQPTQQFQPSGMDTLSPATPSQGPFKSTTFPQARQPSPMHPMTSYATTATLQTELQQSRRSSFEASTAHWPATTSDHLSPAEIYQPQPQQSQHFQSQTLAGFYQAASQEGMQWSGENQQSGI